MGCREDDYRFLQIVDAMSSINQRVNLIGLVVETSIPKHSKGTDCFCSVKIVDESYSSPGISVNLFSENMEKLPHVESAGDIIQLSHVVMKTHGREIYALFNKKFSSFALFEGKYSTNFTPYQVSQNFRPRDQDKKFIAGLRKWTANYQLNIGTDESLSLKEIRVGEGLNLMCKVLHTCKVTKSEWMIFVWDGTDTPPVTVHTKLEDEMENPLPLQLEPSHLSRDILCTFPAVGTVLRVVADQGNEKLGLHLLKSGRWVKFVNVICELHNGLWRALLMPFTKLRYLPNDDPFVLQAQRYYDERVSSKWARMPSSSFPWSSHITETDYEDVPFVTLMNVLTYPEVTAKFRCVVRVVAALPWGADEFRSQLGTYRIRLTLEDPTARIHAFVYAEDGVRTLIFYCLIFYVFSNLVSSFSLSLSLSLTCTHSSGLA
ncbi:Protection of telomeres protein like [Actinidia chinensis var. chinensis]|uniref:Protection of telomeres protein like n=1 Tax=Actinidia chinensis var. chinensis TaxID=1590841 RepID=A0A2R6QKI2_ACTCC|nr:Protection of telomeres protein like [Actinidia chinensis var. chinensis]